MTDEDLIRSIARRYGTDKYTHLSAPVTTYQSTNQSSAELIVFLVICVLVVLAQHYIYVFL